MVSPTAQQATTCRHEETTLSSLSKKPTSKEKFGDLIPLLSVSTGLNHGQLAARMGMSGKTLARYREHPPPSWRGHDIVQRLHGIDPAVQARVAASLDVPAPMAEPSLSEPAAPSITEAIRSAVLHAADQLDITPSTVRVTGRILLEAMLAAGIDVATGRDALLASQPRAATRIGRARLS
jgi:hypothetical protein